MQEAAERLPMDGGHVIRDRSVDLDAEGCSWIDDQRQSVDMAY